VGFEGSGVVEAVWEEIAEWFEEEGGEEVAVFVGDAEDFSGDLERFVALGVADFGEDELGDGGGGEADAERRHGRAGTLRGKRAVQAVRREEVGLGQRCGWRLRT
jgi:hypothetical protein